MLAQLRKLPWRVALFQWRARRLALRLGDDFSIASVTRPEKLRLLLTLAQGRRRLVELGTATAWTSISLLLADRDRRIVSYDPHEHVTRARYLELVGASVSRRLKLITAPGESGPESAEPVDLLYIDSSHDREQTIQELRAWRGVLREDALVVFDDFCHPDYAGVSEAVREMKLHGEARDGLYIHRVAR